MKHTHESHELLKRLICTIGIVIIFLIGRNITLYMVDPEQFGSQGPDIQSMLLNMVSGDMYRCSLFALGIMPYMTVSIIVQFGAAFLPMDIKRRISRRKMDQVVLILTLVYSCILAYSRAGELTYLDSPLGTDVLRWISVVEMTIFSMVLVYMLQVNKDHGVGQQVPIILINIIEGIYTAISGNESYITFTMVLICGVIVIITIMMENVEQRIPVQRVSIHNIYADKNYIAFKLNPIGIMPVMFSTSVFMMVKYLLYFIGGVIPENQKLQWINMHMEFTDKVGVWVYILVIILFTVGCSFLMLMPKTIADNLQKGGDSVVGVYAGRPTIRYFNLTLLLLSTISGVVLGSCMGVSLLLGLEDSIPSTLAMLPSSLMILVGIASNLIEEIKGYYKYDSYKFFI